MYIGLLVSQNRHSQDMSPHYADMPTPAATRAHRFAALFRAFKSAFKKHA